MLPYFLRAASLAMACMALAPSSAEACWAALPDQEMARRADLVVVGKLSEKKEQKDSASATLTVAKVLKGQADVKSVCLRMQGGSALWTSASYTYTGNEEGIWYLTRTEGTVYYETFHPSCLERLEGLALAEKEKRIAAAAARVLEAGKEQAAKR